MADAAGTAAPAWYSARPGATDAPVISAGRAYAEVLGVAALFFGAGVVAAAWSLTATPPRQYVVSWSDSTVGIASNVALGVLSVLVPILLAERRGLRPRAIGLGAPPPPPWWTGLRMAAWAAAALTAGSLVTEALTSSNPLLDVPFSYANLSLELVHFLQAGFIEEVVVLGFLVATLEQARRPRAEIVVVALAVRMSYHIYYGPGVLGIAVWALVFLWLFFRFRSLVPLIVVHSSWDLLVGLSHQWKGFGTAFVASVLGLLVIAPATWLVERSRASRPDHLPRAAPDRP